jgi:hypothetical protein
VGSKVAKAAVLLRAHRWTLATTIKDSNVSSASMYSVGSTPLRRLWARVNFSRFRSIPRIRQTSPIIPSMGSETVVLHFVLKADVLAKHREEVGW